MKSKPAKPSTPTPSDAPTKSGTSNEPSVILTFFTLPEAAKKIVNSLSTFGLEAIVDSRLEGIAGRIAVIQAFLRAERADAESINKLTHRCQEIFAQVKLAATEECFIGASQHWFLFRDHLQFFPTDAQTNRSINIRFNGELGHAYFVDRPSTDADLLVKTLIVVPPSPAAQGNAILVVADRNRSADCPLTTLDLVSHKANWLIGNVLGERGMTIVDEKLRASYERSLLLLRGLMRDELKASELRTAVKEQAKLAALNSSLQLTRSMLTPILLQAQALTFGTLKAGPELYLENNNGPDTALPFPMRMTVSEIESSIVEIDKYSNIHTNLKGMEDATRACREYEKSRQFNRTQIGLAAASAAISIAALVERETAIAFWQYMGRPHVSEGLVFYTEFAASVVGAALVYWTAYFVSKILD